MDKKYKIAMIGLGSIGKRHLRNVDKVLKGRGVKYSIDLIRRKNSHDIEESLKEFISTIYTDYDNVPDGYDIIFITNPTHLHYDSIKKYNNKTRHMFIEKPVFSESVVELSDLSLDNNGVYYVACPLRYTDVIQYVKRNIRLDKVYSARVICSSYLPDWRPEVDYRTTYSAYIDKGGGVSIDLIHEWDYLIYLFGKPDCVKNFRGKISHLEIDSDDLSIYIAKYKNMMVEVHLDYFGKKAIRELQLFTPDDTIIVDILNNEIRYLNGNEVVKFNADRNAFYIKEIENFFDILEGYKSNENDIYMALTTLRIAKEGKLS